MSILNNIFSESSLDWLKSRDDFKDLISNKRVIELPSYRFELEKGLWYKSFKVGHFSRGKVREGIRLTNKARLKIEQLSNPPEKKDEESSQ